MQKPAPQAPKGDKKPNQTPEQAPVRFTDWAAI